MKEVFLIRGHGEAHERFAARMLESVPRIACGPDAERVSMTVTVEPPPRMAAIPFRRTPTAAVSVESAGGGWLKNFRSVNGFAGGYRVECALPVAYERTWPTGQPTPGVGLLTLFCRKPSLTYEEFLRRWHHGHTPLSLRIHPLWHYVRNVVSEPLSPDSPPCDGIVEELVRTRADLLNPFRFFGPPHLVLGRMLAVFADVRGFLDYGSIEPYLVREYWLK